MAQTVLFEDLARYVIVGGGGVVLNVLGTYGHGIFRIAQKSAYFCMYMDRSAVDISLNRRCLFQRAVGDFGREPGGGRGGGPVGQHRAKDQEAGRYQSRQHQTGQKKGVALSWGVS